VKADDMKKKQHKRSPCPVACTLDLIGDKWTLLIIRDMFLGRCYYGDFSKSPEKIATNILADRLEKLVASGLAEKWHPNDEPNREAYRLTTKGKTLKPVLETVATWGLNHIEGTEARLKPK
jgi:DNA-binding HxlR family transcriptional regulator